MRRMQISSSEISVVVQGAISTFTPQVIKSLRYYLPNSEIILSTWKGSNIEGLSYDVLVENTDPGAEILFPQFNQYHNLNRQILSTKNGIKKATRKFVLKIRTDIALTGTGFLNFFGRFEKRNELVKILKERVVICNYYARFPEIFPYHISDWVFFGLKEDVNNIWNIPLAPEPETTTWFYHHELLPEHKNGGKYSYFRHKYCAEQYIWSQFLKKNGIEFSFSHMFDVNPRNINLSKLSYANNLIIISPKQYGIKFLKCELPNDQDIYNFHIWQVMYKDYCDENYSFPLATSIYFDNKCKKFKEKILTKFEYASRPIKICLLWIRSFSLFFYIFRFLCRIIELSFLRDNKAKMSSHEIAIFKRLSINPNKSENVFIITTASGETYLFSLFYHWINKQNTQFYTTRKKTYEVLKLFGVREVRFLDGCENMFFNKSEYVYQNTKIKIIFSDEFWFKFWRTEKHIIDEFKQTLKLNIDNKLLIPKLNIQETTKKTLEKKLRSMKLNINKFVFLSPEAASLEELDVSFWGEIVEKLKLKGFDVFNNSLNKKSKIPGTKMEKLTVDEALLLAKRAKVIVGLRSGLLDVLSSTLTPMCIVYNQMKNSRNPYLFNCYENYTFKKYPYIPSKLFEYKISNECDMSKVIQNILFDISQL